MKKTALIAWPLLAVFVAAAQAATPPPDARAQIEQVVAKFQTALVAKDKAALEKKRHEQVAQHPGAAAKTDGTVKSDIAKPDASSK